MIKRDALYTSNNDEWSTPQSIYDDLDAEFHFTLDPCATDDNHKCHLYFTQEENGLLQDWGGRESSAIRRTVRSGHGSKRHIESPGRTEHLSYC